MSFNKFTEHLKKSLASPLHLKSDWESQHWEWNSDLPPHNPTKILWASTDTEEIFTPLLNKNYNKRSDIRISNMPVPLFDSTIDYYLNNPIEYNLNEYRFRSDSFSIKESGNVFLGCSDTFGVGQRLEHTWPYILSKLRFPNDKIYNLGAPGSGSDTNFRHFALFSDKIKIKNVFHWLPFRNRFEIYLSNPIMGEKALSKRGFSTVTPQTEVDGLLFKNEYVKNGLSTNTIRSINDYKNISAIKLISNEIGVNYYISNFDIGVSDRNHMDEVLDYFDKNKIPRNLLSRDFKHMNIYENAKVVAHFLKQLDELPPKKSNKNII